MTPTILLIGTLDTKADEYAFLREQLLAQGAKVLAANIGVLGTTDLFRIDVEAEQFAGAASKTLAALRQADDRGAAMKAMAQGAAVLVRQLHDEGRFTGVIGMGGSGGCSVITAAMQALPLGVPKVCISTLAGGDTSPYVGVKDVTLIPSITDVAGVNRISRMIMARAAGAVVGMARAEPPAVADEKPIIAASMFGNTTDCVTACREQLTEAGYEVLVFHAVGTGGRMMESLIDEGLVDACLDMTTTEWADELCGGILSAGPDRLSAAGRAGVPQVIAPGCVDMVNFGPPNTVPQKYYDAGRQFYEWNPTVTLMRTTAEENRQMGEIFAKKANAATGPVAFLLPLGGVSILDGEGQPFCDRVADAALFEAIRANVKIGVEVIEVDANINDAAFSTKAVELMLALIEDAGH